MRIGSALKRRAEVAGVFVNSPLGVVERLADEQQLTMVQLHGDEGQAFCAEIARRTGCRVIKVFRVRSNADVQVAESYRTDFHLFDAHSGAVRGGSGKTFDWELLHGRRSGVPTIVGGGLDPENVGQAIAITQPFAIDVASGVERELGRKDPELVRAFIDAAAAAAPPEQAERLAPAPGGERG